MKFVCLKIFLVVSSAALAAEKSDKCTDKVFGYGKRADACMNIKDFHARTDCFQTIDSDSTLRERTCSSKLGQLRKRIMAEEHNLYPQQKSAIVKVSKEPIASVELEREPATDEAVAPSVAENNHSLKGESPQGAEPYSEPNDCDKLVSELTPLAEKCLGISSDDRRSTCGESIGNYAQSKGYPGLCADQVNQLHRSIIEKEKSLHRNSVL